MFVEKTIRKEKETLNGPLKNVTSKTVEWSTENKIANFKTLIVLHPPENAGDQCDQIGLFLKCLSCKSSLNI